MCLCVHVNMCVGVHVSMCGMCTYDHMLDVCVCMHANVWI